MPQVQQSLTLSKQNEYAKQASAARIAGLGKARKEIKAAAVGFEPYSQYGTESLERMNRLFQDPSYLESLPGYKFAMEQGLKGTTAMRSKTSIFSGETLKALTEFSAGLASQTYNQEWQKLQAGIGTGFGAEQQQAQLATTGAEIQAGIGEAAARQYDQAAASLAAETSFGKQVFGQWSGAFASASASSVGSCWVAEELYGRFDERTFRTRQFVLRHAKDDTKLGDFLRKYIKYGKEWAKLVATDIEHRKQAEPIWDALHNMAVKEQLEGAH